MKLIGSLTSPYVRKVRVVLAEKKIDYEFVIDSPWTPESNVPNINPLGKIPVLELDDETILFDSRVISEYLDNVAPNNKLMPAPNRERTEVKRWEALADGICDAAALVVMRGGRQSIGVLLVLNDAARLHRDNVGKNAQESAWRRALRPCLEPVAVPRYWRIVDEIPVNSMNKRVTAQLQELFHEDP